MKHIKSISAIVLALSLTACATGHTEYYAAETARHLAEAERWKSMAAIAATGDSTVKAVAMVTMGGPNGSPNTLATAAPRSPVDSFLQAASIFVPAIVQGYGIRANSQLGMRQSDNASAVAQSTNNSFVGIASKIQSSNSSVSNVSNYNSDSSMSGSYNPATTSTTTAADNSNQGNTSIPAIAPVLTAPVVTTP